MSPSDSYRLGLLNVYVVGRLILNVVPVTHARKHRTLLGIFRVVANGKLNTAARNIQKTPYGSLVCGGGAKHLKDMPIFLRRRAPGAN